MSLFLPIFTIILGIGVFVTIVIFKIRSNRQTDKLDIRENATFIRVGDRRKFTNGYSKGLIKSQLKCKNGCTRIEFFPIDYEQGENKKRPDIQCVIVKNEFVKRLAVGDESDYREEVVLVDRFKSEIPKKLRNTSEGYNLAVEGQKAHLESIYGQWVSAGDDALQEMILRSSRVGMTKMSLAEMKEHNEALRNVLLNYQKNEDKEKN